MTTNAGIAKILITNLTAGNLSLDLKFAPNVQFRALLATGASADVGQIASMSEVNQEPSLLKLRTSVPPKVSISTVAGQEDIPGLPFPPGGGTVAILAPARAASTANLTLSGLQTVDTVVLAAGDRILVKNQTSGQDNGIYVVDASAWSRSSDFNSDENVLPGAQVNVVEGAVNGTTTWILATPAPIVVGTTVLSFTTPVTAALTGVAPVNVTKAAAAVGVAGTAARADHKHDVTTAVAVTSGLVNAEGAAASLARSDHTHLQANASVAAANVGVVDANGIGVGLLLHVTLTSGGAAGTGDDVAIFTANAPFKFRIIDAWAYIATAHAGLMGLYSLAAAGGTKYSADIDPTTAGLNRSAGLTPTATSTVALNGSLFLNRADRSVTGELFVLIARET